MPLTERISNFCIQVADWISHPVAITLFPVFCTTYIYSGGAEGRLTLILSVLAISMTQMVLNAQNVDSAATKLQIAELVRAIPEARNLVISEDLTKEETTELKERIEDDITGEVQLAKSRGDTTKDGSRGSA